MTEMTPIYFWKMGDVALARICKEVYAKVQVVKDEEGLFFDDKVLGISSDGDGIKVEEELCYYVEVMRSKERIWLPYTSMFLAERSRPFYGTEEKKPIQDQPSVKTKSRVSQDLGEDFSEFNDNSSEYSHQASDYDNSDLDDLDHEDEMSDDEEQKCMFDEFIHYGKDIFFDELYDKAVSECDKDVLHYLHNVDASTEDKFEAVMCDIVTENEIENYLNHCWRYNYVSNCYFKPDEYDSDDSECLSVHINWCLVCGKSERLKECINCPASFHVLCKQEWVINTIHRKNPPKIESNSPVVEKILSSTRTKCIVKDENNPDLCPTCLWGPKVGYNDIVWHKLNSCSWWPARVLTPGSVPPCLQSASHEQHQWPLRYYGTLNHSWADASHMCLFLPRHSIAVTVRDDMLRQAVLDACDDYITVYLA